MKVIILAAGSGTRLGKYTKDCPKGMLFIDGKTLIQRQLDLFRSKGINDISIVRGFCSEKINYNNVKYYDNEQYDTTNMVVSFLKATDEFNDDIIVSYADIMIDDSLIDKVITSTVDVGVTADMNWKYYWKLRYGGIDQDIESLLYDEEGNIYEIGKENVSADLMQARYVGVIKFSKNSLKQVIDIAKEAKEGYCNLPWKSSGRPFSRAYMTDLIQAMIDRNILVKSIFVNNGWIEFDTTDDYEKALEWIKSGKIKRLLPNYR